MDHRQRTIEERGKASLHGIAEAEAVDPFEVSEGTGDTEKSIVLDRDGHPIAVESVRDQIVKKLPESWSKHEIDQFITTYYGKLPEEAIHAEEVEEGVETVVEEVDDTTLPVSNQSRRGYTLDTTLILDGRVVRLRDIYDAGQLVPTKVVVTEGTRRFPRRAIQYGARVVDRPLFFTITEETYRSLSKAYPYEVPHDEPLMARGVKNVQAKVSVLKADTMERVLPKL